MKDDRKSSKMSGYIVVLHVAALIGLGLMNVPHMQTELRWPTILAIAAVSLAVLTYAVSNHAFNARSRHFRAARKLEGEYSFEQREAHEQDERRWNNITVIAYAVSSVLLLISGTLWYIIENSS